MRKDILVGLILFAIPVIAYLYTFWLSIKLFMIPAFTTYFELYGVLGTFGIIIGLFISGFVCSYTFFWMLLKSEPSTFQPTFKE
jgi:hypothetical protein